MFVRKTVTVPSTVGDVAIVDVAGVAVVVEKTPDNTPAGVPQIRSDSPGSAPFPAFNQTKYEPDRPFELLYVEGRGGTAGELYLTIITEPGAQYRISGAVE